MRIVGGGWTVLVVKVCPTEEEVISGLAHVPPSAVNKLRDLELPPCLIITCLLSPSLGWAVRYLNVMARESPHLQSKLKASYLYNLAESVPQKQKIGSGKQLIG